MSEPVYRCQAQWREVKDGPKVHCNGDGVERLMINKHPFSLSGMQMKLQANKYHICDDCWPKAKPALMVTLNYSEPEVEQACLDAGMTLEDLYA